jgi:uncharacterized repeat protein (TIGR03803 family)
VVEGNDGALYGTTVFGGPAGGTVYKLNKDGTGRTSFEAMNRAIAVGGMRPIIDRTFAFSEVHDAYRYFARGKAFGKVVITVP